MISLDISKVEAGHLTLEYREVNPEQIAAEVLSLLQVKAIEKDLVQSSLLIIRIQNKHFLMKMR